MYMQIGREKNRDMLVTEENYVDIAENVIMQLKKEKTKEWKRIGTSYNVPDSKYAIYVCGYL